jgi:formate-nitrite transporter family protein
MPDGDLPQLEGDEHAEVEQRAAPTAHVVYETIRTEGESTLKRPSAALAWSGLAAGLSMGFSMLTQALLQTYLPEAPWRTLIVRFGYTVGFLIVILGRQQLFTQNTLTPILPLLAHPNRRTLSHVLRLWLVVLVSNLIGTILFAVMIAHTSVVEPDVQNALAELSREAIPSAFGTTLIRSIFAGWLIALMIWLLPFAETARIFVIIIITYFVALGDFTQIIVGSVEVFYGVTTNMISLGTYLGEFLLPTLLGNIIGGVVLVATLSHAQVISDKKG